MLLFLVERKIYVKEKKSKVCAGAQRERACRIPFFIGCAAYGVLGGPVGEPVGLISNFSNLSERVRRSVKFYVMLFKKSKRRKKKAKENIKN